MSNVPTNRPAPYLFFATVLSADAATFSVVIAPTSEYTMTTMRGVPLASCFAKLLGAKEVSLPEPGSVVFCYQESPSQAIILGVVPQEDTPNSKFGMRTSPESGESDAKNFVGYGTDHLKSSFNNNRPIDTVPGDWAQVNEFGVLVGIFQQLATLKGSELAQVQCFLMDDLVRVISHNFQHFSALGEFKISHDGKTINAEFGATHLQNEALGTPQLTSETDTTIFEQSDTTKADDSRDFVNLNIDERVKAIERVKFFLGRLGDLFHLFISAPANEQSVLDGSDPSPDTGLLDVQLTVDGGLRVRSASELVLEKTNLIRVPKRIRAEEDPAGTDATTVVFPDKPNFEFDRQFTNQQNPYLYFLQLRDYLAYTQEVLGYQNIQQFSEGENKDFFLPNGVGEDKPAKNLSSVDPTTDGDFDYRQVKSGFYTMKNGGVVLRDAFGSAIVMEGGNIYLQPAKDLINQPLRNMVSKVGGYVSTAAKKDIELSSTDGSFKVKAETEVELFSNTVGIKIHTDGPDGVVQRAKESGIYGFGKEVFLNASESMLLDSNNLFLDAANSFTLASKGSAAIAVNSTMLLEAGQAISLTSDSAIVAESKGSAVFLGKGGTVVGTSDQVLFVTEGGGSDGHTHSVKGVGSFENTVDRTIIDKNYREEYATLYKTDEEVEEIKFYFIDQYNWDATEVIPQTMAQQEDQLFSNLNLKTWEEKPLNDTFPFPGSDKWNAAYVTSKIENERLVAGGQFAKNVDEILGMATLTKSSFNNYKVVQ